MSSFYLNDLKILIDIDKSSLLLWVFHVDKKAPHLLVVAFRRCLERHPDAKLVYIGTGTLFQITKDLVKQFKLDNNVELRGLAGREEIQNEMCTVSFGFLKMKVNKEKLMWVK